MEAITLKILKVFNNNSVAAISNSGSDIILVGSGIGFHKKVGDQVDESKIERTYVFQDDQKTRFEKSLEKIPLAPTAKILFSSIQLISFQMLQKSYILNLVEKSF